MFRYSKLYIRKGWSLRSWFKVLSQVHRRKYFDCYNKTTPIRCFHLMKIFSIGCFVSLTFTVGRMSILLETKVNEMT